MLLHTTDLAMAQSRNSTEELDLPQFSDLSTLWCFTWDKLDVKFDVSEMLERQGAIFSHWKLCSMWRQNHVDLCKLVKPYCSQKYLSVFFSRENLENKQLQC